MSKILRSVFFFSLCLYLLACEGGPDLLTSKRPEVLSYPEGQRLLLKEVTKLYEWNLRQQKKEDSTDSYVFKHPFVKDIYQNPYKYFENTKYLLKDNTVDIALKIQLVVISQCLTLNDYLTLGSIVIDAGSIELMTAYISPGPEYGTILDDNYLNPRVIELLSVVISRYPLLKETVDLTKSGTNSNRINEYRKSGEQYPVLSCLKKY